MKNSKKIAISCCFIAAFNYSISYSQTYYPPTSHTPEEIAHQLQGVLSAEKIIKGYVIRSYQQHVGNPSQVPVGTPVALVVIAAILLLVPAQHKTQAHHPISEAQHNIKRTIKSHYNIEPQVHCKHDNFSAPHAIKCDIKMQVPTKPQH